MTTMSILVMICIWVLGFYILEALGVLVGSLEIYCQIVAKLLCSCLILSNAIAKLHAMDEKIFNDFLIAKWKWVIYVSSPIWFMDCILYICNRGIYHNKLESIVIHAHHLGIQWRVHPLRHLFTLVMYEILIRAPKVNLQMATGTIWIC